MAPQTPKTPKKQHSAWLMLGGAMFVSLLGWAGIVRQAEGPALSTAATEPVPQLSVVELPAAMTSRTVSAQAPAVTSNQPSVSSLRRVTRPVLRSRSSN